MSILESILLGVVQGITEFLPVSSSGHLVAAQALFKVKSPGLFLEVSLHFGTLLAVLFVFRAELRELVQDGVKGLWLFLKGRRQQIRQTAPAFPTAVAIIVGTIPAAAAGIFLGQFIEPLFEENLRACSIFLFVTGLILLASRYAPVGTVSTVGPARGFLIGLAQAFALLPGISRSGSTIVTGLFLKLPRKTAVRFAFLLAVPALAGAMGWELMRRSASAQGMWPAMLCGTTVSAVVGAMSLLFLVSVIEKGKLHMFAAYCLPAGAALFLVNFFM